MKNTIIKLFKNLFYSRLAKKQLLSIVIFSSIITLIGTLIQLIIEYRSDIHYIHVQMRQIETTHLKSLNSSLWMLDDNQLKIQLKSILSMRDIVYIEILEKDKVVFSAGRQIPNVKSVHKNYPMNYNNEGVIEDIGTLNVYASLGNVYQRMYRRVFVILVTQGFKTFIVSLFILYIIHRLVIRRLIKISSYAQRFSLNKLDLNLKATPEKPADPDELDLLINAINDMRRRIIDDMIKKKRADEALKQSEERYKSLFKNNHSVMLLIDPDNGNIVDANPAAVTYYGWSHEEMTAKKITDINTLPREKVFQEIELAGKEKRQHFFFRHRLSNGNIRDVEVHSGPITVNARKLLYSIIHDITERKQMESYLQQAQKLEAVGTLAGGIAHDFNNMLGIITGNISYAQSSLRPDDELYRVLAEVQQGAKRAQNLTQQLLTFARGGAPIKKVSNLNLMVKESANFVVRGTKSRCEFHLIDNLWPVEIDPGQINQVLGNLVINANQAMPNGGIITLRTNNMMISSQDRLPLSAGQYVKISIEDQGIGISEKNRSNIFDPYFSTKQKGSGLGLATAYSIIQKHGGHISVESIIDEGTTFHVYLPASSKVLEHEENNFITHHHGQGRILIMDDDQAILKMSGRILNKMGYKTAFARDGTEAVKLYKKSMSAEQPFDLVILDLTVPGGLGGPETMSELLKINPKIKAIVSSGYSNDPVMANYQEYGFSGVVPKPYTKYEMAEVLNKIFEKGN